jgi:hypothetical protein
VAATEVVQAGGDARKPRVKGVGDGETEGAGRWPVLQGNGGGRPVVVQGGGGGGRGILG